MRKIVAVAVFLLALPAAKPLPPPDAPDGSAEPLTSQAWRDRGVPVCVARLHPLRTLTPEDIETICGCTFDTYLDGHGTNPLPGLESDRLPVAMEAQLLSCTARIRPDQRSAMLRLGAIWPEGSPMIAREQSAGANNLPLEYKPPDADVAAPQERDAGNSGGGFMDWIRSITWPDWLTGASVLWWIAIGIFVFGLLILKIRRRDPRKDLVAPPSSMRRGAPPQPPRRPDLFR